MPALIAKCRNCGHVQLGVDVKNDSCQNCGGQLIHVMANKTCICPNCGFSKPKGSILCNLEICPRCESPLRDG